MKIYTRIILSIILVGFLFLPFSVLAQLDPANPCTDPANPCPIDSNIIILIAGALIIAAKKAFMCRKIDAAN